MPVARTEIEWAYTPSDFFEAPYRYSTTEFTLVVDQGRVVATLTTPQYPIDDTFREEITSEVRWVFTARQILVHRVFDLRMPTIRQFDAEGKTAVTQLLHACTLVTIGGSADTVARDAAGNVIRDTEAERITEHVRWLDALLPKVPRSPVLRTLLGSYSAAVNDPANELVHLYEVRDTLSHHFGSEKAAQQALTIAKSEWQRLGALANHEPLTEGRHRGKHPGGKRPATASELDEARQIVQSWIIKFAHTV